jgi:uncharacterized membrane protein
MKLKRMALKIIMAFIVLSLLLISCKNNASESEALKDTNTSAENKQVVDANKSWHEWTAPSQISDLKLTSVAQDPFEQSNLSSFSAVYEKDSKKIRINIIDGSSEKGRDETRKDREVASKNVNSESEYGHEKTLDYKDTKALEEYLTNVNQNMITFLLNEKYGISIKTEGMNAEEAWQLIDALNLKQLD